MADSWPMIRTSGLRQWAGLDEDEREFYETVIARRDHYHSGGCITGGVLVSPQIVVPIWSVVHPIGGTLDLVTIKEDML